MMPAETQAFTILAGDKPHVSTCSRCSQPISGRRVVVATWNGHEFWYCETCQAKGAR